MAAAPADNESADAELNEALYDLPHTRSRYAAEPDNARAKEDRDRKQRSGAGEAPNRVCLPPTRESTYRLSSAPSMDANV